ncbi:MAG: hypothetical protein KKF48_02130 [Nanoarchaeota archaeon]|nr:hypothetical protein [Nanoarchaeota archaeon]MBU1027818.1 hypothetical protein [Nanoarchaeota archaeon]
MVRVKRMNESFFVKMQKDLTATGELIRARQDEKQALLNEFDAENKRFFFGKISEKALASSVKKTNNELKRLDKNIRETMSKARSISAREMQLVSAQAPISFRATLSGIVGLSSKKKVKRSVKKRAKKKVVKKKAKRKAVKKKSILNIRKILKKEKKLDRKFIKKKEK